MTPPIDENPPMMSTGSALRTTSDNENCTPTRAPHKSPATNATTPAPPHAIAQSRRKFQPDSDSRHWVVGDGAQADPSASRLKQNAERGNEGAGYPSRKQVQFAHFDRQPSDGRVGDPELQPVHLGPVNQLREPFEDEGETEGRQEQSHRRGVDERTQDDALDGHAKDEHHGDRPCQRPRERKTVLGERHEGERGEENHRSLREVENAQPSADSRTPRPDHRRTSHRSAKPAVRPRFPQGPAPRHRRAGRSHSQTHGDVPSPD